MPQIVDVSKLSREDLEQIIVTKTGRPIGQVQQVGGPGYNIPLSPQTDKRRFPDYSPGSPAFRAYPKIILRATTAQDREEWIQKQRLLDNGRETWMERPPVVGALNPVPATSEQVDEGWAEGVGFPLIARNEDEERHIYGLLDLPMPAKTRDGKFGLSVGDEDALRKELAALRGKVAILEKEKEVHNLEAQIADHPPVVERKKPGRKPGSKNKVSNVVPLGQFKPEE